MLIMKTVAASSVFECYKSESRWFTNEVVKILNELRTGEQVSGFWNGELFGLSM